MARPFVFELTAAAPALRYAHLGVAVSQISASVEFYSKLGFDEVQPSIDSVKKVVTVMRNTGGLELHLFQADSPPGEEKNILMDSATVKFPGHTHMSFRVPSVAAASAYLADVGIPLSGTRGKLAIFCRDPDFTTVELERNDGLADETSPFTRTSIGVPGAALDHIGIRILQPELRLQWYGETFGFTEKIGTYVPDADVLKNGRPWIAETPSGTWVNFIINGNQEMAAPSETQSPGTPIRNILTADGNVRCGIVYVAFAVPDLAEARRQLAARGIPTYPDSDVHLLGLKADQHVLSPQTFAEGTVASCFLQDPDGSILRLVSVE